LDSSDLIDRARSGDNTAWEALVREHQDAVFRLSFLLLADSDEAADLAQETFIRAFRSLSRFDTSRPLRPWLLTIAVNLARNRRRSLGRYLAALRRFGQASPEPVAQLAETSGQQWEAQQLWLAVRRLRSTDQQVIYLRFFLELSEAEMAATLNVAAGTIKSRLHRALGRLRGVVNEDFPALREERQL
jgi:RNA polymerase sigma-70 factor, ECF subfamily